MHSTNSDSWKAISTKNRHEKIDAAPFKGKIAPDGAPSKARRLRLDDRLYHLVRRRQTNRRDGDASPVIARSSCDEAIQGPRDAAPGLLRCARNDGWGVGSFISGRRPTCGGGPELA